MYITRPTTIKNIAPTTDTTTANTVLSVFCGVVFPPNSEVGCPLQSAPLLPAGHMHVPLVHCPILLQLLGHSAISHALPDQPESHTQAAELDCKTHDPCPEQPFGQDTVLQSLPV